MEHLYWHKPRPIVLRAKIEGLPDDHPSQCLFGLSRLLDQAGNYVESKQHLVHALEIWRERGRRHWVARASESLAITNRRLGLYKEGIPYAKEALEIWEQLDNEVAQSQCLCILAGLLHRDDQLGPAEEAVSQSIDLLQDKDQQHKICQSHRVLGEIHHSKGETETAINHFETAIKIASSSNWHHQLSRTHYSLAVLFSDEHKHDSAHTHIEHAKSYATSIPHLLGCAMHLQALFLYNQRRLEEAKSEALGAAGVYEGIGATTDVEDCRALLRYIETEMEKSVTSDEPQTLDQDGYPIPECRIHRCCYPSSVSFSRGLFLY